MATSEHTDPGLISLSGGRRRRPSLLGRWQAWAKGFGALAVICGVLWAGALWATSFATHAEVDALQATVKTDADAREALHERQLSRIEGKVDKLYEVLLQRLGKGR